MCYTTGRPAGPLCVHILCANFLSGWRQPGSACVHTGVSKISPIFLFSNCSNIPFPKSPYSNCSLPAFPSKCSKCFLCNRFWPSDSEASDVPRSQYLPTHAFQSSNWTFQFTSPESGGQINVAVCPHCDQIAHTHTNHNAIRPLIPLLIERRRTHARFKRIARACGLVEQRDQSGIFQNPN